MFVLAAVAAARPRRGATSQGERASHLQHAGALPEATPAASAETVVQTARLARRIVQTSAQIAWSRREEADLGADPDTSKRCIADYGIAQKPRPAPRRDRRPEVVKEKERRGRGRRGEGHEEAGRGGLDGTPT
ncbi:MAG: hypothetical protein U0835_23225 [Isosphaeraceae bacterium]